MFIKSIYEKDGMAYIVIADEANANNSESLKMSVKNWKQYCTKYVSTETALSHVINEAEYDELHRLAELTAAILEAARILSSGDKSARDLKSRLQRKFSADAAEYAVCLMEKRGYLNESAQCRHAAETALKFKRHGPLRIKSDLMAHGYSAAAAESAVRSITELDYMAALEYNINKKFPNIADMSAGEVKKAAAALMRLGFTGSAVFDEIKKRRK